MEWRSVIEKAVAPLAKKTLPLCDALGAVVAEPLYAQRPSPAWPESLRDGYLCYRDELGLAIKDGLPIVFEAAAGSLDIPPLVRGTAQRIFTGALVQGVCAELCVVPLEQCDEHQSRFFVKEEAFAPSSPFIAEAGSVFPAGVQLLSAGMVIDGGNLARLITAGIKEVEVFSSPLVCFVSSGSELVAPAENSGRQLLPGEKYAVNDLIISDGIASHIACGTSFTSCQIKDSLAELTAFFQQKSSRYDLIITSGGTGPGKYDLIRSAFCAAGGEVLVDSFAMLPAGRAIFGLLKGVPVLCLPGPPHAVTTLLYEVVIPLVRLLRGEREVWPEVLDAFFMGESREPASSLRLRSGELFFRQGKCLVKEIKRGERGNCHIFYPAGKRIAKDDLVRVHLLPCYR